MEDNVMRNYSFGTSKSDDVKTYSWTCKEMGLSYYMEVMRFSSHKTYYQFYIVATETQWENLRKLLHIRRPVNGTK